MHNFFAALQERGLIQQSTDIAALDDHLNQGVRTAYCGFDPTADSLHVGSVIPLIMLRRFQLAGHKPIALVGGATGLIGDPGGKDAERQLNPVDTVAEWTERLKQQAERFIDFDKGAASAEMANNMDWISNMSLIHFLRDMGKNFSVNTMIAKDSVRTRLEREGSGISYTEFSYSVLQAIDFHHLFKNKGCTIQFGGNDQWGNIVAGLDLIRRLEGSEASAHCFTLPLLLKADGKKFGKSESGTVWIDADKTSVFKFYQFWLNVADDDVEKLLRIYTFLSMAEIHDLVASHSEAPHLREGQRVLAQQVTQLVHGEAGLTSAERITDALFGKGDIAGLTEQELAALALDGLDGVQLEKPTTGVQETLVQLGLAKSNTQAREFIANGAVKVNGVVITDAQQTFSTSTAMFGQFLIFQRGKKEFRMARW